MFNEKHNRIQELQCSFDDGQRALRKARDEIDRLREVISRERHTVALERRRNENCNCGGLKPPAPKPPVPLDAAGHRAKAEQIIARAFAAFGLRTEERDSMLAAAGRHISAAQHLDRIEAANKVCRFPNDPGPCDCKDAS